MTFGWLVLGESLSKNILISGCLVILGIFIINKPSAKSVSKNNKER